jgi:hypothetical protein
MPIESETADDTTFRCHSQTRIGRLFNIRADSPTKHSKQDVSCRANGKMYTHIKSTMEITASGSVSNRSLENLD